MDGICTLGNDRVYDQLVALLNSIQARLGPNFPVCIYPFDEQLSQIQAEIANRPNVFIYDDQDSIRRWDTFMSRASPASIARKYRIYGGHRRFCAFDGPFDRFVYMDADTLLLGSLDSIFAKLNQHDCVVYDFQFLNPDKVYNTASPKLLSVFSAEKLKSDIFCSGFYASKKGLFNPAQLDQLVAYLEGGEAEVLYPTGDQPVLNYMLMRSGASIYNLAHHLPEDQKTGCCVTSPHFQEKDQILYDQGKPLTYLHYIGVAPDVMQAVCAGGNFDFPYRDLFLHYRYLHEPENRPIFTTAPQSYWESQRSNLWQRALRKFKKFVTQPSL